MRKNNTLTYLYKTEKACKRLSLEPNEVQSFLEQYYDDEQEREEWRHSTNTRDRANQAQVNYRGLGPTGLMFIEEVVVMDACAYLEFLALDDIAKSIKRLAGKKIVWPPKINLADFKPQELGHAALDLPSCFDNSDVPSLNDGIRILVTFSAAEDRMNRILRVREVQLPAGVVVLGPLGVKQLPSGGKYRFFYPVKGTDIRGSDVHTFSIFPNDALPPSEGGERARPHFQAQSEGDAEPIRGEGSANRFAMQSGLVSLLPPYFNDFKSPFRATTKGVGAKLMLNGCMSMGSSDDEFTADEMPLIADSPTIMGMSVLQISAEDPQPVSVHPNPNSFGPSRKQNVEQIAALKGQFSARILLQFRLTKGYGVVGPAGYTMNFDDVRQGPADDDGSSVSGVGGVYTLIARDQSGAPAADLEEEPGLVLPAIPTFHDRVYLRMNFPEKMAIYRDFKLLSRMTEPGIHQMSMVTKANGYGVLDLLCENGRYGVFGEVALPSARRVVLGDGQQHAMNVDEPQ